MPSAGMAVVLVGRRLRAGCRAGRHLPRGAGRAGARTSTGTSPSRRSGSTTKPCGPRRALDHDLRAVLERVGHDAGVGRLDHLAVALRSRTGSRACPACGGSSPRRTKPCSCRRLPYHCVRLRHHLVDVLVVLRALGERRVEQPAERQRRGPAIEITSRTVLSCMTAAIMAPTCQRGQRASSRPRAHRVGATTARSELAAGLCCTSTARPASHRQPDDVRVGALDPRSRTARRSPWMA